MYYKEVEKRVPVVVVIVGDVSPLEPSPEAKQFSLPFLQIIKKKVS